MSLQSLTSSPAIYTAIQIWSETGLGHTEEAVTYLKHMEQLEQSGRLVEDANEASWIVGSLRRIVNRDAPQEVKTRAESLIKAINERLMSQYPLGTHKPASYDPVWREIKHAGYMREPEHERPQPEQQEQQQLQVNDADEMAATAGRLLERVAENQSEKFQNSQFLSLMRKLRDREVEVLDDNIVEVDRTQALHNHTSTSNLTQAENEWRKTSGSPGGPGMLDSRIPPIDREILNHAATDFEMPLYEPDTQQYALSPVTGEPIITDEVTDQFRAYNTRGTYHRA